MPTAQELVTYFNTGNNWTVFQAVIANAPAMNRAIKKLLDDEAVDIAEVAKQAAITVARAALKTRHEELAAERTTTWPILGVTPPGQLKVRVGPPVITQADVDARQADLDAHDAAVAVVEGSAAYTTFTEDSKANLLALRATLQTAKES